MPSFLASRATSLKISKPFSWPAVGLKLCSLAHLRLPSGIMATCFNFMETKYQKMRVFGRVQRVLFRDSARRRAAASGLTGYVRNAEDGSLEIVAAGDGAKVAELFEWAKRGPIFARVDRYEISVVSFQETFGDFIIKY